MNVGININITAGSLKINRCSYLEVNYIHGAIINTADFVITDIDGVFKLNVPKGAKLIVSFIGYTTETVVAKPSMEVVLKDDSQMLGEVEVVAYG